MHYISMKINEERNDVVDSQNEHLMNDSYSPSLVNDLDSFPIDALLFSNNTYNCINL